MSTRVLRSPGFPGSYRATTPFSGDCRVLIEPVLKKWSDAHGVSNVPPIELLELAFHNAWVRFMGPRRKKFAPNLSAMEWALTECDRLCRCWVSFQPDNKGTYAEHASIASWCTRTHPVVPTVPKVLLGKKGGQKDAPLT